MNNKPVITNETKVESIIFLGGRMISIVSTAGELREEAKQWNIKWFSELNNSNEVTFYNYPNFKERYKILDSHVKIVAKMPNMEEHELKNFSDELIKYVGAY